MRLCSALPDHMRTSLSYQCATIALTTPSPRPIPQRHASRALLGLLPMTITLRVSSAPLVASKSEPSVCHVVLETSVRADKPACAHNAPQVRCASRVCHCFYSCATLLLRRTSPAIVMRAFCVAAGKYSNITEASDCIVCGNGTANGLIGQTSCTVCPLRQYRVNLGQPTAALAASCKNCPNGWVPDIARTSCSACSPGFIQVNDSCVACGLGNSTLGKSGQTQCTVCTSGRFANVTGLPDCYGCTDNTWSSSGAANCTFCPAGQKHQSHTSCFNCNAGQQQVGENCFDCAKGQYAPIGKRLLASESTHLCAVC
jgi:hypothetical protein